MPAPAPERRQVWQAMSALYLDTDIDNEVLSRVAEELARSPYPLDELQRILRQEVHPVLVANLYSVAPVWDGFDPRWLEEAITAHLRRPWPMRWWRGRAMRSHAVILWHRLIRRIAAARRRLNHAHAHAH
ncbi:hypothetical protein Psesu_2981 [Pseudoxanthomonas suwonensis 11-1]|uniref:DUF7079 domain-containing protein n=1 Tax=Pseudoxanthomonas suwonensis (strain 11-1) TaxID=743721 RepID=E6WXA6_PSEUU|nr:hypothetical protein Psesu_2981 [Pseudoxanthomonas suwonensis 11-1]